MFVFSKIVEMNLGDKLVKEIVKVRFNFFDGKVIWEEFVVGMKINDVVLFKLLDEYFKELFVYLVLLFMDVFFKLKKSILVMDLYVFILYWVNLNCVVVVKIF